MPLSVEASDLASTALNGARLYSILLGAPLKPGETTTLEVLYVLTHTLEPFPAEISQSESELVYFRDSAVLLSPYHVLEQVTYIKTPSNSVVGFLGVPTAGWRSAPAYSLRGSTRGSTRRWGWIYAETRAQEHVI